MYITTSHCDKIAMMEHLICCIPCWIKNFMERSFVQETQMIIVYLFIYHAHWFNNGVVRNCPLLHFDNPSKGGFILSLKRSVAWETQLQANTSQGTLDLDTNFLTYSLNHLVTPSNFSWDLFGPTPRVGTTKFIHFICQCDGLYFVWKINKTPDIPKSGPI